MSITLYKFKNQFSGNLSAAIPDTTTTTISVTGLAGDYPASGDLVGGYGIVFFIDTETFLLTGISGSVWTVVRGWSGNLAAPHSSGATLSSMIIADEMNSLETQANKNIANGYPGLDSSGNLVGTISIFTGTSAALATYVAHAGQPVFSTDTKKLIIGNGSTNFSTLAGLIGPHGGIVGSSPDEAGAKLTSSLQIGGSASNLIMDDDGSGAQSVPLVFESGGVAAEVYYDSIDGSLVFSAPSCDFTGSPVELCNASFVKQGLPTSGCVTPIPDFGAVCEIVLLSGDLSVEAPPRLAPRTRK